MIFLDNASTTKMHSFLSNIIQKYNEELYYNPSALYDCSIQVEKDLAESKNLILKHLNARNGNLIFTSGATESNNLAIFGSLTNKKGAEFLFSSSEHPSAFNCAKQLENKGYVVKFIKNNQDGTIDEDDFRSKVNSNTAFISVIHCSNETGVINNIKKLVEIAKRINTSIVFHSDGVQALGKIDVNISDLGVDLYTISSHKIHGPKGVGALYVKNKIKPLIFGGEQQNSLRAGTENVSGIIAFSKAVEHSVQNVEKNKLKVERLRNYLKQLFLNKLENFKINECENNSPYILSLSIEGIKGEILMHMLEKKGVYVNIGSACSSKKVDNRILKSMNVPEKYIVGTIRISFSELNTIDEIEEAGRIILEQTKILRSKI